MAVTACNRSIVAVVVASFGGLLLMGMLTVTTGNEVVPAAATDSSVPTTTEELLATLGSEEVEPGVLRITGDGVHDPSPAVDFQEQGFPSHFVDVAPDGGVWLSGGWGQGVGMFFGSHLLDVAPDGALWLNATTDDVFEHAGVARFDGVAWQRFLDGHSVHDIDVAPDGAVWVRAADGRGESLPAPELFVITPEAVTGIAR